MTHTPDTRIKYIEPTNIAFYSNGTKAIVHSNELMLNPLEEFCIAVDLEVMIPNRKACSLAVENNDWVKLNYSSTNGTISFLHGTDGAMTTNFTDVNVLHPSGNTAECLGIESISIEYSAWLAPQVTIKFVDVRGSSVLLPEEEDYQNKNGIGSIYRALFMLPSPIFKLKVKGFYGKGVTYYLKESNIDIDLDSSSGNFGITAKFIGMMYRVYTDIPMVYLCAAPFMSAGESHWQNMVDSGVFVFHNKNGTTSPMCTFPELRERIADASYSEKRQSAAAQGQQVENNVTEKINALLNIRDTCPLNDWYEGEYGYYHVALGDVNKQDIIKTFENYIQTVSAYDMTYKTSYLENFEPILQFAEKREGMKHGVIYETNYTYSVNANGNPNIEGSNIKGWFRGKENISDLSEALLKEADAYAANEAVSRNLGSFIRLFIITDKSVSSVKKFLEEEIDKRIEQCEEEMEKAKAEFKAQEEAALEEALGFSPSIQNVYELVFAHMDTFMHCFYEQTKNIKEKLDSNNPERSKTAYNIDNTDIKEGEIQLPPYPAFYKEISKNGEDRKQMLWPGELRDGDKLDEVNFVKDLLSAAALYTERAEEANEYVETLKERAQNNEGNIKTGGTGGSDFLKNAPSISIKKLIPLTINDFVKKDSIDNPYGWVKNMDDSGLFGQTSHFEDAVLGTFAPRALHYMSVNTDKKKEAKTFGKLEAINFVKAFGEDYYSHNFFEFIKRYADDKREHRDVNYAMKKLCSNNSSDLLNFEYTEKDKTKTKPFLDSSAGAVHFGALEDEGVFPVGKNSVVEMAQDFNSKNYGEGYIPESRTLDTDEETFYFFESRDYVNEIYKQIETLSEEDGYNISGSEIKAFKDNIDPIINRKDDISYVNGTIYDASDMKLKGVNILNLLNSSHSLMDTYYVTHPTMMDEHLKDSLFDEPFYLGQGNTSAGTLAKAYMFLSSMPIRSRARSNAAAGNIADTCRNGVDLKSILLREGSFYWREREMGAHNGTDPIKTLVEYDGKTYKYKGAAANETYMVGSDWQTKNLREGDYSRKETISPLPYGSSKSYINFEEPEGCTESRKRVLADAFEKWALTSFAEMEPLLTNPKFYVDNKFKEGLNTKFMNDGTDLGKDYIRLNNFLRDIFFEAWTIFDYYAGRPVRDKRFKADRNDIETALRGFMESLEVIYKDKVKAGENAASYDEAVVQSQDPFNNNDLRLSTYMTLKNLYDNWFAAPYKGQGTWSMTSPNSEFKSFSYIDSFYHDIGRDLNVNITKVEEWLSNCMPTQNAETTEGIMRYTGKSLYDFLTETAQHTGGILIAFPQRIGGVSSDYLSDMFKAYSFNSNWETDESTFVFIYTYKPSEHLGNGEYDDDGFDLTNEEMTSLLADSGYTIPAFGVTYAKQNQSFFKNITLNTSSPAVTEASIAATMAIASKGGEGIRETSLFGQDLYRVKTSYSYKCAFEMMGCMQVMPLMYFQLNNVPFWRGGYQILKVSHNITAGDVTTHVEGQRINKYSIPLTEGIAIHHKEVPGGGTDSNGEYAATSPFAGEAPSYASEDNIEPNPDAKTDEVFFDENNITEEKPIIALTPAHGPQTQKGSEWFWSQKLIDEYIIPELKKINFYDGTNYGRNIQRCNRIKDDSGAVPVANYSGTDGYNLKETKKLINKYGSKCVISIVPHWNGGHGSYFTVYDGKQECTKKTYPNGNLWWDYDNCKNSKMREDSYILGEFFREEAKKLADMGNNNEFHLMPVGMMKGGVKSEHLLPTASYANDKTDPAVGLDCACVLTENFFADYGADNDKTARIAGGYGNIEKNGKHDPSVAGDYDYPIGAAEARDGLRYKYGEGWLFSDEGLRQIAKMHVEAIRRYINNLHSRTEAMNTVNGPSGPVQNSGNTIYDRCANILSCETAVFKAVIKVESGGQAFLTTGKPPILFEGHVFWRCLNKLGINPSGYTAGNEDILYPKWTKKYYKRGLAEYDRLERAKKINETAALQGASWGLLQILGENYAACGCRNVQEFVNRMCMSEDEQLLLGTEFIRHSTKMTTALQNKDWATFARYYNGSGYAENQYDTKLAAAYNKIKQQEK